jgi:RNA polymerase sigma factor (sigma-70 family)
MLLNAHHESHRKRRWRESLTAEPPETALPAGEGDVHSADAIRRAVSHLSQGQREVVALRFFMGLTEPEIAASLNIARGTVKSRLSRALSALSADTTLIELRDGGAS